MSAPVPKSVSVAGQCQCGQPHCISCIRYSTFEQVAGEKNPGERQRSINNATAKRNGLHILKEIVIIDVSGRHVNDDPDFQQLFADMQSPLYDGGVILAEQSRLFRPDDNRDYGILDHFKRNRKIMWLPSGPRRVWKATDQFQARIDGAVGGLELSTLKDRAMSGKERDRINGEHPGGNHMLPPGIKYKRIRNENGRVISKLWTVDAGIYEQVRRAFDYLHRGVSYDIAGAELSLPHYAKRGHIVWGPLTGKGFKDMTTNPIWTGHRYYDTADQGEEYQPKRRRPLAPGEKPPKKRRKRIKRGDDMDWQSVEGVRREVLLAPIQLHDATTLEAIPPLLTQEEFDRAQELVRTRAVTHYEKTSTVDPFLARKVLVCECGKRFYVRKAYSARDGHDWYYCSSLYHKASRRRIAKPCGICGRYRREDVDRSIVSIMGERLLDPKLIDTIFRQADSSLAEMDKSAAEREARLASLRSQRQDILRDRFGARLLTDQEAADMLRPIDAEIKALQARTPAAQDRRMSAVKIVKAIARFFVRYTSKSLEKQRELLERAVSEIVVQGRGIISMTFRGGFLAAAKIPLPS